MKSLMKKVRYFLEYIIFVSLTSLLRILSIDKSADICAKIARIIGPYLKVSHIARKNLRLAYKGMDIDLENKIIDQLWDNFGRFIGEFPHLHTLSPEEFIQRVEIIGLENIKPFQDNNQPFILFSGHLANWEFVPYIYSLFYPCIATVYRKANNPFVNNLIKKWRDLPGVRLIEKGPHGSQDLVKALKSKCSLAMLVDQKMNEGISVPLFGIPAMTAPAIAKFSVQFNYPIIPLQIIRTEGSYFKVILSPAIDRPITEDKDDAVFKIMENINGILEHWIKENPGQWFWFHNRWGK
ncbi:MAG: lipid A biosynthesis lauroyl acyltransferase [Pseudomonadota bacterium]